MSDEETESGEANKSTPQTEKKYDRKHFDKITARSRDTGKVTLNFETRSAQPNQRLARLAKDAKNRNTGSESA
ncbi:hypothetical protein L0666_05670 [Octadecabacter sp. CECT 8868]|uniref:hypothetical protein n=1 Tax=Octadecabacter algicola TaxID=2909342 RepID=UPI001F4820D3|nr:hypothetical protein [Octadecabacter algicola]MCF2904467.1 hypothetical protein [Octadecabacter algicola]